MNFAAIKEAIANYENSLLDSRADASIRNGRQLFTVLMNNKLDKIRVGNVLYRIDRPSYNYIRRVVVDEYPSLEAMEEKEKVVDTIKAGRVQFAPAAADAIENMDLHNPDFTIEHLDISCWGPWKRDDRGNQGGFCLYWESKSAGNGRITFHLTGGEEIDDIGVKVIRNCEIHCDPQCMGEEFVLEVFKALISKTNMKD